ncbi:MAG: hypothetical protein HOE90_06440 [Bacteriovoracaceae bacterium]|jgi:hypothetical protein|nr:hypothetical protein [Bacteriovoracaceae bacterium]
MKTFLVFAVLLIPFGQALASESWILREVQEEYTFTSLGSISFSNHNMIPVNGRFYRQLEIYGKASGHGEVRWLFRNFWQIGSGGGMTVDSYIKNCLEIAMKAKIHNKTFVITTNNRYANPGSGPAGEGNKRLITFGRPSYSGITKTLPSDTTCSLN